MYSPAYTSLFDHKSKSQCAHLFIQLSDMLCYVETNSFCFQRTVQNCKPIRSCNINAANAAGIQNYCFGIRPNGILNILL